jgi:hypothetical protein
VNIREITNTKKEYLDKSLLNFLNVISSDLKSNTNSFFNNQNHIEIKASLRNAATSGDSDQD